jgi:hypothetical protein
LPPATPPTDSAQPLGQTGANGEREKKHGKLNAISDSTVSIPFQNPENAKITLQHVTENVSSGIAAALPGLLAETPTQIRRSSCSIV